jgi:flagellin
MRIGSYISTDLSILSSLNDSFNKLTSISTQLSTAKKSSSGSGLFAISKLSSELATTNQAIRNVNYADYALDTASQGMTQTLSLMNKIRTDLVAAGNSTLNASQKAALQTDINNNLSQIDKIGSTTNFAGEKVLTGETLTFQISTDLSQSVSIQMPNISTTSLGGTSGSLSDLASGGTADISSGNLDQAMAIVNEAQQQVTSSAATTASFQKNTLDTASATLEATRTTLSSALSTVQDTNMAQAMSDLIKTSILNQTLMVVLKTSLKTQGSLLNLLSD